MVVERTRTQSNLLTKKIVLTLFLTSTTLWSGPLRSIGLPERLGKTKPIFDECGVAVRGTYKNPFDSIR